MQCGRSRFDSWVGKFPWRRDRLPTPLFLPGESLWTEEPKRLQSMELQTVKHDWTTKHSTQTPETNTTLYINYQFSSVTQSFPILCNPMACSIPGIPVHHQLLEVAQTHVLWVSDSILPSHLLSSPSPPAFNHSQHEGLFQWVSSSHQVVKVLQVQLQHQSFHEINYSPINFFLN